MIFFYQAKKKKNNGKCEIMMILWLESSRALSFVSLQNEHLQKNIALLTDPELERGQ